MKPHYFFIQGLMILSLGLVSCSSDNQTEQSASSPTTRVEIRNSDGTLQKINNAKRLQVSSLIALTEEDTTVPVDKVTTITTCQINQVQGLLEKVTEHTAISQLAVKDILPSMIFSPLDLKQNVYCSLNILTERKNSRDVRIRLTDVEIINTQIFYNHEMDFLNREDEETPYFHYDELVSRSFSWPKEEGQVETLCSNGRTQVYFNSANTTEEYFPESLFLHNNTQKCRFIFRTDKTVWITKSFFIQRQRPNIEIESSFQFLGTRTLDYSNDSVLLFSMHNSGDADAFLKIATPNPKVLITPAFGANNSPIFKSESYPLAARWEIKGGRAVEAENLSAGKILKLQSGETLELHLKLSDVLVCSFGTINNQIAAIGARYPQTACNISQSHVLQGYRYAIEGFPSYTEARHENIDRDQWNTPVMLSPAKQYKVGNQFRFWAPFKDLQKVCPGATAKPPKVDHSFITITPAMRRSFRCEFQ